MCRYLLKSDGDAPPHSLRLICGNGLSGDVWEAFQARFHIPQVLEFYAATEGNFSLYNAEGKVGAIGRVPGFLKHRFGIALIRRGADGEPAARAGWLLPARRDRRSRRGHRQDRGRRGAVRGL